mmetsp:Transcript_22067/g.63139  ORF Transcript_22067/g.63139 Transcript_22067/m.63139 type:complete len:372 (+) Transcript_22067:141-1256(+)|eukprot:CAMPEP_0170246252 /NCGR_PEP_ID=MMETSP0116_2-20130129/22912_1 /TAXON_ID=400756 /ORGANISM="Durinskia baltica, Strain CSIRO CS-38" /LENGTH=371 /DNA_ID=CAMNT_0010497127 /DNA_START=133 /DNA_END=1248 /DNA_ORIENTATION=-
MTPGGESHTISSATAVAEDIAGQVGDVDMEQRIAAILDDSDYPGAMLEILAETEREAIRNALEQRRKRKACGDDSNDGVPVDARTASIHLIVQLAGHCGVDQADIGKAVGLLDLVLSCLPKKEALRRLPAITVAVLRLVQALDGGSRRMHPLEYNSAEEALMQWLVDTGHVDPASQPDGANEKASKPEMAEHIAKTRMVAQERSVLELLQWRINVTSAEEWLRAFCARLGLITNVALKRSLDWVLEQSIFLATTMMLQATVVDLPPRELALGALCHGLISARLISVDLFRKAEKGDEWLYVFARSQPGFQLPQCALPIPTQRTIFQRLEASTDASAVELQRSLTGLLTHFAPKMCAQAIGHSTPGSMRLRA